MKLIYLKALLCCFFFFFFQAEDGIRDLTVTGVQTCALPICNSVPKEGNRVSIIARLCIRFRQGYLHFEREVWPGRMTQTILEIIDGGLVFFLRAQQAGKAIRGQGKARINRQRFLEFVAGLLELPQILKGPPKCVVGLERIRLRAEDDAEFVSSSQWRVILQERKRKLGADFEPIGVVG